MTKNSKTLQPSPAANERGLTLIELLLVVMIIAFLMTMLIKGLGVSAGAARGEANVIKMEKLKAALEQFRFKFNKYPSSLDGLVRATSDVGDAAFFALASEDDLKDAWGNPYIYKTENGNRSFSLTSLGKDAASGGENEDQDVTLRP